MQLVNVVFSDWFLVLMRFKACIIARSRKRAYRVVMGKNVVLVLSISSSTLISWGSPETKQKNSPEEVPM